MKPALLFLLLLLSNAQAAEDWVVGTFFHPVAVLQKRARRGGARANYNEASRNAFLRIGIARAFAAR